MHGLACQSLRLLVVSLIVSSAFGCAKDAPSSLHLNPFASKPKAPLVGVRVPGEQVEALKKLAKEAGKKTPDERQQISLDLAREIAAEPDSLVRRQIIRTLAVYHTPTSFNVLKAGLGDKELDVRIACCDALGQWGGREAVPELSRALNSDSSIDVRLAAARALGQTHDPTAVAPLSEVMTDPDPAMQSRALASLRSASGRDFGTDVNAWREYARNGQFDNRSPSVADRFHQLFR